MVKFYYIVLQIFYYMRSSQPEKIAVWILPVQDPSSPVKNILFLTTPSECQSPSDVPSETTYYSTRSNEDSEELGGTHYYHYKKHHNNLPVKSKSDVRTILDWSQFAMDKIVNGVEVEISNYPYHVAYGYNCGGAIIHKYWIITAGHCGAKTYIKVGSEQMNQGTMYIVKRTYIHPKWLAKNKEHLFDYDFQLVMLEDPLKFSESVQPIKVGRVEDMIVGTFVKVTGWGHTKENGNYSEKLRAVSVPIVSKEECQNVKFPYFRGTLTPRMFCAGYSEGTKDACQGDSGGPAVAGNRLLGIISFGYGCATPKSYGVYSKVANVREWIETTTELQFN